jgi:hypothetical protein
MVLLRCKLQATLLACALVQTIEARQFEIMVRCEASGELQDIVFEA